MRFFSLLLGASLLVALSACSNTVENSDPTGQNFPQVSGQSLEKVDVILPTQLAGKHRLLLIGYVQDAQFDIDRWLIGLDMVQANVTAYEIPTIKGLAPRMFEQFINDGMRAGIPKEIWGGVITVYKGAEKIVNLTGNENPNNARVILLDDDHKIIYFYDRGFSVAALNDVRQLTESDAQ